MRAITIDTNILLRGVFGRRISQLLNLYANGVIFYCPEICIEEAHRHVPQIAGHRGFDLDASWEVLSRIESFVEIVPVSDYTIREAKARARIAHRDPDDWPILATALLLDCPLWTEDQDFFGTGVTTWMTATVEIYLKGSEV